MCDLRMARGGMGWGGTVRVDGLRRLEKRRAAEVGGWEVTRSE